MKAIQMLPALLIVIAIAGETIISSLHGMKVYDKRDSIANFLIGCCTVIIALMMRGISYAIFTRLQRLAFFHLPFNFLSGLLLFLFCDIQYYWFHRLGHVSRFFWASHAIHHSSQKYNYTVGMRLPFTNGTYRFLILSPMCLLGFSPGLILLTDTLVNYYTFFIHTETIGKLGWLEKFLNTPSHHRVHHSSNPHYIDKNFGGVLIIWDKLLGTFTEEEEKPRYGLTKPFLSYNPVKIALDEWQEMFRDLKSTNQVRDIIKVIFGYPGWKPIKKEFMSHENTRLENQSLSGAALTFRRKRYAATKIIYLFIISLGLLLCTSFTTKNSYSWELKKNESGIIVYTENSNHSPLKKIRVVTKAKSSLSGVVALLLDTRNYPEWMEGCKEARILKVLSDHELYNYQVTDLPWPISDRDIVANFKIEQDAVTHVVRFKKTAEPQFIPTHPDRVRIRDLQSTYTLTPLTGDSVLIEMVMNVNPGGNIPAWLVNANIIAAPYKSTVRMIERLPQYQSATFSFIKEVK